MMVESPSSEPPAAVIARARRGDEEAFADLVTPYRARLFSLLCRALRERADAEDAMQEVLFQMWRGLDRYEHRGRFGAWLFTIAYRVVHTRARGAHRTRIVLTGVTTPEWRSDVTPGAELEASETEAVLTAAVDALPDRQRHVFLLRHTSELTFAEIAAATGEPLNTVLSHMHYAMTKLRHALRAHERA